jgi:hypothetical protein
VGPRRRRHSQSKAAALAAQDAWWRLVDEPASNVDGLRARVKRVDS